MAVISRRFGCITMLYNDRLETTDNSQRTNSAKTLKIFNVYSSFGLIEGNVSFSMTMKFRVWVVS